MRDSFGLSCMFSKQVLQQSAQTYFEGQSAFRMAVVGPGCPNLPLWQLFTSTTQSIGPRATPAVDFKHCSTCAAEKPAVQFWKRRRSIDGLQLVCIQCQKQAAADLRQQRAQWLPFLGATECAYCDELKSLPGFAQRTGTLKGLQYECKQCASRRMSQLYTDNKTKCSVGPETEKVCCRCMLVKSCNEFYRQSNRPDGLQSCCKLCLKQYNYKRYHGHKSLTPW